MTLTHRTRDNGCGPFLFTVNDVLTTADPIQGNAIFGRLQLEFFRTKDFLHGAAQKVFRNILTVIAIKKYLLCNFTFDSIHQQHGFVDSS